MLRKIMTAPVVTVAQETNVADAIKVMEQRRISCLVVTSKQHPIGIFTERTLLRAKTTGTYREDVNIIELMTLNPITVHVNTTIQEAYLLFVQYCIRHLVVVHDDETLAGIVTETDFLNGLGLEYFVTFNDIGQIATKNIIYSHPDDSLLSAMQLMTKHEISSVIAVDDGKPVGMLTERDIVRITRSDIDISSTLLGEVMSQPVISISWKMSSHHATEILREQGVRRLVLTNDDGGVYGIVTETDIIKGLKSEYIESLKKIIKKQVVQLEHVRRELDEKKILESMMYSITDIAFLVTDADFCILHSNSKTERLFGYSPADFYQKSVREAIFAEGVSTKKFNEAIGAIHRDGSCHFTFLKTVEDQPTYIESTIFGIKDDEGRIQGYVLIGKDITKRTIAREHLKSRTEELEESNAALRVLLKQRELDREEMQSIFQDNVEQMVLPFLSKLGKVTASENQKQFISSIEANLREISTPQTNKISSLYKKLTPAEIQVVNLLKNGHSSKEIAELLNLSLGTVFTHRRNIRKKMGISNKNVNLQSVMNQF